MVAVDISGDVTPTNFIAGETFTITKAPPYTVTVSIPIFCLDEFMANNGRIFVQPNAGTLTVANPTVFIVRTGAGNTP